MFQDIQDAQPQVVAFAQDLIRRCLQRDPSERLQSMDAVLAHPFLNEEARNAAIARQASAEAGVGTRGKAKSGATATTASAGPSVTSVYPDGSYAVVVGINDYLSSGIGPDAGGMGDLKSARQDAELVRETLRAKGCLLYTSPSPRD